MKKTGFLSPLLLACMIATAQVQVTNLKVENLSNPLGIDRQQPHLSWQLQSTQRNVMQSAYEVRVGDNPAFKGNAVWSSGRVNSDQSVHVPYAGNQLQSGKKYYWEVRVWDNSGKASNWSQPSYWQMGLLQPSDWQAQWIEPGYVEDSMMRPSPLLRKEFAMNKKIQSATAFITAHGLYEGYINGKRIGDVLLNAGLDKLQQAPAISNLRCNQFT